MIACLNKEDGYKDTVWVCRAKLTETVDRLKRVTAALTEESRLPDEECQGDKAGEEMLAGQNASLEKRLARVSVMAI